MFKPFTLHNPVNAQSWINTYDGKMGFTGDGYGKSHYETSDYYYPVRISYSYVWNGLKLEVRQFTEIVYPASPVLQEYQEKINPLEVW